MIGRNRVRGRPGILLFKSGRGAEVDEVNTDEAGRARG